MPGERARVSTESQNFLQPVAESDAPACSGESCRHAAEFPEANVPLVQDRPTSTDIVNQWFNLEFEIARRGIHRCPRRPVPRNLEVSSLEVA